MIEELIWNLNLLFIAGMVLGIGLSGFTLALYHVLKEEREKRNSYIEIKDHRGKS